MTDNKTIESKQLAEVARTAATNLGFEVGEIKTATDSKDHMNGSVFPILMKYPKDMIDDEPDGVRLFATVAFIDARPATGMLQAEQYVKIQLSNTLTMLENALYSYKITLAQNKWPAAQALQDEFYRLTKRPKKEAFWEPEKND